jgi:hypothetical protein
MCVCLFFFFCFGYTALKIWPIILTVGQHCHFLIFGFGVAKENGEDHPFIWTWVRVAAHTLSVEAEKTGLFSLPLLFPKEKNKKGSLWKHSTTWDISRTRKLKKKITRLSGSFLILMFVGYTLLVHCCWVIIVFPPIMPCTTACWKMTRTNA